MGHNKIKWNITLEKGIEIAHSTIIDILRENMCPTPLNELVILLNSRTKHYKIHNQKKHNCFVKYLKVNYGGIISFLDNYHVYGIKNQDESIHVVLLEDLLEDEGLPIKQIIKDNEWIFV